jgi:phosphate transport system permease protein
LRPFSAINFPSTDLTQMTQALEPKRSTLSEPTVSSSPWLSQLGDSGFQGITFLAALLTASVPFWMCVLIFKAAQPAIAKFGLAFIWTQEWNIDQNLFGALPYIYGTLVSSAIALILALPVGVAVAIITSERVLPEGLQTPIAFLIELIAAIPSVIVGLWGRFILIPVLEPGQQFLYSHFKWLPIFSTQPFGPSLLMAGVVLAIMIVPTIAAISREVFLAISQDMRNGALALGATQWESIVFIALGRALGETMAVTMVIGNVNEISVSLLNPGNSIPALLANQFGEASDPLHIGALMYLALMLFLVTLAVNALAAVLVRALTRNA